MNSNEFDSFGFVYFAWDFPKQKDVPWGRSMLEDLLFRRDVTAVNENSRAEQNKRFLSEGKSPPSSLELC